MGAWFLTRNIMPFKTSIHMLGAAFACACALSSCGHGDANAGSSDSLVGRAAGQPDTPVVEVVTLHPAQFTHQIVSNGRLRAAKTADLSFASAGTISKIYVRNGQHVVAGQPLASLDVAKLEADRQRLTADLERARLEMHDVIISQGYDPSRMQTVPTAILDLARTRSGYRQAELALAANSADMARATLTAPFAGTVANLEALPQSSANGISPLCRIIGDGGLDVTFTVLESELPMLAPGDAVSITPFAGGDAATGRITEINPVVDDAGQVKVRATTTAAGGKGLLDGMNVRVKIDRSLGQRLLVPKTAVVMRSDRQVVFTYQDGKAIWNYVTTGLENFDSYEITDGLTDGQQVIVTGNEFLGHEAPVRILKE